MKIYKIMLSMWVWFWVLIDFLVMCLVSLPLATTNLDAEAGSRARTDVGLTLFSSVLGILLNLKVLSVEKDEENKALGWYILVLGFVYFFGKSLVNLILNLGFLEEASKFFWLTPVVQIAWLFPSLMFFVANSYFAIKYTKLKD